MTGTLSAASGGVAAAILFSSFLWASYCIALQLDRTQPIAVRWATTLSIFLWLAVAVFWVLSPLHLWRLWIVLPGLLALAVATHRRAAARGGVGDRFHRDLAAAGRLLWRELRGFSGWALGFLALTVAVRCLRGSGSPPLGWDALTYHLLRAGRWVQHGGLVSELAPDAWSYYEYYPLTGDILWAWTFLPLRGDALLTLAGTAVWGTVPLAVYAAARAFEATPRSALLAAAAVGALPSCLTFLSSGYVDNLTLAAFLLASVFLVRLSRGGPLREAPLAAGLLGLMVGVKTTTVPFLVLGGLLLGLRLAREKHRARWLAACLVVGLVGAPGYLRAWTEKGSPVYPFGLEIAGHTLFEPNEEAALVNSGATLAPRHRLRSPAEAAAYLLYRRSREGAFVNPGPGAPVILLLGLVGAVTLLRRRGSRLGSLYLVLCAAFLLALYFSNADLMVLARTTIKATTVGRYLTPILGAAAILGAVVTAGNPPFWWSCAIVAGALWSRPMAWIATEAPMMLAMLAIASLLLLGFLALQRLSSRSLRGLLALLLVGAAAAGHDRIRDRFRYPLWAAATHPQRPLFHMHRLHPLYAGAWPLWQHFDDEIPHRIAVTAGWDGFGHNWYRYPFLGSRLQNEVVYVPITDDGAVIDYRRRRELGARADFAAWVSRLLGGGVDHVVSLAPRNTLEDSWLTRADRLFRPEIADPAALHAAFRLAGEVVLGRPIDHRSQAGSGDAATVRPAAQQDPESEGETLPQDVDQAQQ